MQKAEPSRLDVLEVAMVVVGEAAWVQQQRLVAAQGMFGLWRTRRLP